jgi:hypothetical protein
MLSNVKKLGVAAAVATALGASGAAQAIVLGHPGDALLVPYGWTTGPGQINTMISLINASPELVVVTDYPNTLTDAKVDADGDPLCDGELHWYFFDERSVEVVNDTFPVTCEDWVGIDWANTILNRPSAQNVRGYLVITDTLADEAGQASTKILFGTAFQIRGNWATQAFIPVLPLLDNGTADDEVNHATIGFLADVNPIAAGMPLAAVAGEEAWFSLRYYLQQESPVGSTEFVLWFPDNDDARANQPILVFDPDEDSSSARTSIPNELNILLVSSDPAATNPAALAAEGYTGAVRDELDPVTGFVLFPVADGVDEDGVDKGTRGGIAFSLIGVDGSNAVQVQTELAHERGVWIGAVGGILE